MKEIDRESEQVKLRLRPADAARLRRSASMRGLTLAQYVIGLLEQPAGSGNDPGEQSESLEALSRLASAVSTLRIELADARSGLGRALGLVKHLFVAVPDAAEPHHVELGAAARDLRAAIARTDASIGLVADTTAALRHDLEAAAKRIKRILG